MENTKLKVEGGEIEKEILDVMSQDDILAAISDEKQKNRLILNCFCELLNEITALRKEFDHYTDLISTISADKLENYFKELKTNLTEEEKRVNLKEKIGQSHKKSKKSVKKSEKSVK